jgi:hypothetical protein
MMVLLWLAVPLVALVIGIVWAYLLSRPPRPTAMQDSVEAFSRFRQALGAPADGRQRRLGRRPRASTRTK